MHNFKIYYHPLKKYKAVKDGWSWPAFFFTSIWAITKGMWKVVGVTFLAIFFFIATLNEFEKEIFGYLPYVRIIGKVLISLIFGVNGNEWVETYLNDHGFDFKGSIYAKNKDSAISEYFNKANKNNQYSKTSDNYTTSKSTNTANNKEKNNNLGKTDYSNTKLVDTDVEKHIISPYDGV